MNEIYQVTKAHRTAQQLSLRGFAQEINKSLVNTNVSYGTVSRWEQEENYSEPDMYMLFECLATYSDWRAEWARDCLKSMWHDLFLSGVVRVELPKAD